MCIEARSAADRTIARSSCFLSALYTGYLKHAEVVNVSGSLAGQLARVEPTLFQSARIQRERVGKSSPDYARCTGSSGVIAT
jgi:hypothetical protein